MEIKTTNVAHADFEELLQIRIASMKESLEAIGRFDPERARERLQNSFNPFETRFIILNDEKVGFYALSENDDHIFIDHLYVIPNAQNHGIGRFILDIIKLRAIELELPIRLLALKKSKSNEFYIKNGFKKVDIEEWDNVYLWQHE